MTFTSFSRLSAEACCMHSGESGGQVCDINWYMICLRVWLNSAVKKILLLSSSELIHFHVWGPGFFVLVKPILLCLKFVGLSKTFARTVHAGRKELSNKGHNNLGYQFLSVEILCMLWGIHPCPYISVYKWYRLCLYLITEMAGWLKL